MDSLFININISNDILNLWIIMEFSTFILLFYLTNLFIKNNEIFLLQYFIQPIASFLLLIPFTN